MFAVTLLSPSLVHSAYYRAGVCLLANATASNRGDTLLSLHQLHHSSTSSPTSTSSSFLPLARLMEACSSFTLESRIADMTEMTADGYYADSAIARALSQNQQPRPIHTLSELATQHMSDTLMSRHLLLLLPLTLHATTLHNTTLHQCD